MAPQFSWCLHRVPLGWSYGSIKLFHRRLSRCQQTCAQMSSIVMLSCNDVDLQWWKHFNVLKALQWTGGLGHQRDVTDVISWCRRGWVSLSGVTEYAGSDMGDVQEQNAFDSTKERVIGEVSLRVWSFFGGSSEVLFLSFSDTTANISSESASKFASSFAKILYRDLWCLLVPCFSTTWSCRTTFSIIFMAMLFSLFATIFA